MVVSATKYQPYPEYKNSGSDWMGMVPGNWDSIAIGRLFTRIKRTDHVDKELLSVYRDHGVVPKSSRDDNNNKPSDDLVPYQLVQPNDLVLNKMKTWQGSIAISEYEGIVSPAYFVYKPNAELFSKAHPKYIHYLLRNPLYIAQYLRRSKGIRVNQWDLDPDEFKLIELLLPEKDEQIAIINFLDHETAKIDTLIDKQQQLIKLLKEKRQAVISHAVTKGLNPAAPMKDSGVEWLGDVPEHWVVTKSSYVFASSPRNGISPAVSDSKNAIPTFSISAVRNGEVDIENNLKWTSLSTDEAEKFRVNSNDILLVRGNGNLSMVGQAGSVNGAVPSKCIYPDILIKVEISKSKMTNEFFVNSWNSFYVREQLERKANTTNGTFKVSGADIKTITMVQPPINEQQKIVQKIDELTGRFSVLLPRQINRAR